MMYGVCFCILLMYQYTYTYTYIYTYTYTFSYPFHSKNITAIGFTLYYVDDFI